MIGVLPSVSTAIAAMQHPRAALSIIEFLLAKEVAITASNESPAPATSAGFEDKAGKC